MRHIIKGINDFLLPKSNNKNPFVLSRSSRKMDFVSSSATSSSLSPLFDIPRASTLPPPTVKRRSHFIPFVPGHPSVSLKSDPAAVTVVVEVVVES